MVRESFGLHLAGIENGIGFRLGFNAGVGITFQCDWRNGRRWGRTMNGGEPAITPALDRRDEDGVIGGVSESVAQAVNGAAETVIEIDEDAFGPESLAEFVAG